MSEQQNEEGDAKGAASELEQLGMRLKEASSILGSQKKAAIAADVSLTQWERYIKGSASPAFMAIVRFGRAALINLNWLAYGEGPMRAFPPGDPVNAHLRTAIDRLEARRDAPQGKLDEELLQRALEAVEEHLAESQRTLSPAKKAALVGILYTGALQSAAGEAKTVEPETVRRLIRLAG